MTKERTRLERLFLRIEARFPRIGKGVSGKFKVFL